MSEESDTKVTEAEASEAPAHVASTLPPASEEEGLTDAELSAKRGLSHRDGPSVRPLGPRAQVEAIRQRAREAAKEAKAP
jgi:hypothetical protein